MRTINKFILILIFYVNSYLFKSDYDSKDYIDPVKIKNPVSVPQSRVISWKRGQNGVVVTTSGDKEKSITVPNCGKTSGGVNTRIIGGNRATIGQFPWTVLIEAKGQPFCVGAILNERWIITAAHCFKDRKSREGLTIRAGSNYNKGGVVYHILKIIVHQKYNYNGMENSDLALLKTESIIQGLTSEQINLVNGVCLPRSNEEPKGKTLLVSGWGRTAKDDESRPSKFLKFVRLDIMSEDECARRFKIEMDDFPDGYSIYRSQICALTKNKDACKGDSGGPAIEYQNNRAVLIGVVSFGIGCANDFPGVYTKISHFIDWITKTID